MSENVMLNGKVPPGLEGIQEGWELIGPPEAVEILYTNSNNRLIRNVYTASISRAMVDEEWEPYWDPIIIFDDGTVGNAQHRLLGVIDSGTEQWFKVMRNVPKRFAKFIDGGIGKNLQDRLQISDRRKWASLRRNYVSYVRGFFELPHDVIRRSVPWSTDLFEILEKKVRHHIGFVRDAISDLISVPSRLQSCSCVTGIARAHMAGVPEDVLLGFAKTFFLGEPSKVRETDHDYIVLRVRANIVEIEAIGGNEVRNRIYLSVAQAVKCFFECISRCAKEQDPYPLTKHLIGLSTKIMLEKSAISNFRAENERLLKQNSD